MAVGTDGPRRAAQFLPVVSQTKPARKGPQGLQRGKNEGRVAVLVFLPVSTSMMPQSVAKSAGDLLGARQHLRSRAEEIGRLHGMLDEVRLSLPMRLAWFTSPRGCHGAHSR